MFFVEVDCLMHDELLSNNYPVLIYLLNFIFVGGFGDDTPKHDNVPNMKLVMNPEGIQHNDQTVQHNYNK